MKEKIKEAISKFDLFLFRKFGSNNTLKFLENMKEARIIFSYLNEIGQESKVRFVGGCVRKALSGGKIDDIDLATSLEPDQVKEKLLTSDIKVIDTGISHGTLTLFLNKKKFEITTLRKDISTDGRHANVEFTSIWSDDALRRDFSINAIYSDIDGRIYDPTNGIEDLKNGIIRFIGSAETRIQEDYLRILRYFRFFLQYSKHSHPEDVIKSIKKNINGLNKISNERIFDELKKIMCLNNIYELFSDGDSKEIILNIFPQFKYHERLKALNNISIKFRKKIDFDLILALLIIDESNEHEYFCHKFKTSNKIKIRFKNISNNFENLNNKNFFTEKNIKKMIYYSGKSEVNDLLLFTLCLDGKIKKNYIEQLLDYVENCKIPKFPISGDYLKELGYETGQILGLKLKSLEEKWIENNFAIDKKIIEKSLNKTRRN